MSKTTPLSWFLSSGPSGGASVPCLAMLGKGGSGASLQLQDFNNLRWLVAALRMNGALRQYLVEAGAGSVVDVVDYRALVRSEPVALVPNSCVVLWDGLNSLIEVHAARPDLAARGDLSYFHVGSFSDVERAYPVRSMPLFPARLPAGILGSAPALHVPAWVGLVGHARKLARTFKNARQAPRLHRRLQAGGCALFFGRVRPTAALLDGFFRGASLAPLRSSLVGLEGFDWTAALPVVRNDLAAAYARCRAAAASTPADFATVYALLNVLHRMGCLAELRARTPHLVVNEYGIATHFDPHDTGAYRRNLFVDFGSICGQDLLYPRTVDLGLNHKRVEALRFLLPGQHLAGFLANTDATAFQAMCESHARLVVGRLADLRSRWGQD